ncbi:RNA polymerase sigma factor [Planctomycetes bacterium TBK1r]|uniref:RNA polymerase sigma factor RpoE n=1 Tax=Stieleria magnilauensis TaxID=2527963 RepID=A0ABX5Y4D2_9BACT|nr:RNA polymerase sigma factor RpoE [Planctomycetes bacterium TBK1r]
MRGSGVQDGVAETTGWKPIPHVTTDVTPFPGTPETIEQQRLPTRTGIGSGDRKSSELSVVDAELIDDLLSGSSEAWEKLIDRYGALVRSRVADVAAVFQRGRDWSTIDDVTAEVFATLLARDAAALRAFRNQSSLATYLAVIATRVARRVMAKLVRHAHGQRDSLDDLDDRPSAVDPESLLIDREERDRLLTLVDRLPQRQKDLVVAFYREQQTYAEISHRFDIPIGSIGTTLRRAEERLRQWIDDETE